MKLIDYFVPAVATLSLPIFYLIIYFQSGDCKWSALKALLDRVKASWTTGGVEMPGERRQRAAGRCLGTGAGAVTLKNVF